MSARARPWVGRAGALALVLVLAACTAVPDASGPATGTPPVAGAAAPLQPLAPQSGAPVHAPQSRVASVRYDLAIGSAGDESTPDDDVPGDGPSGPVIQQGGASWYGLQFHQRKTANGERFDMGALTAAHKTLPFGTRVCVRSLVNGREVLVRVNDRGPFVAGRVIDLSQAAAEAIDMVGMGIKQVLLMRTDVEGARCNGVAVRAPDELTDSAVAEVRPAPARPVRRVSQRRRR